MSEDNTGLKILANDACGMLNDNHVIYNLNLLKEIENQDIKEIYQEVQN